MTHEDIRTLLPAYAAGALDETGSNAVRAHMATGCTECLREVFRRPIGLPRAVGRNEGAVASTAASSAATAAVAGPSSIPTTEPPARGPVTTPTPPAAAPAERVAVAAAPAEPVAVAPAARAASRGPGVAMLLVVALALALAALAAWMVADMRRREAVQRTEAARLAARLAELESARAALAARVQALERDLAAAQAETARQADAARMSAEESAQVKRDLEAAQQRIVSLSWLLRQRETEAQQRATDSPEDETLRGLVAAPGLELLALRAVPPFKDVRGHVLWKPGEDVVRLYAFDLPPLPEGGSYRVRVGTNGGELELGPAFTPAGRGNVELAIRLRAPAGRVSAVEIVIEPGAEPVLAGRS